MTPPTTPGAVAAAIEGTTNGPHGTRAPGGGGNWAECVDGFTVSLISGPGTHCIPKPSLCLGTDCPSTDFSDTPCTYPGPYVEIEVGMPSERPEPWQEWQEYAESPDTPTGTIYSYVPVKMVRDLIALHGGEKRP